MKPTKNVMRINNKRIIPYIVNLNILLLLALTMAIVLIFMPVEAIVKHISPYYLAFGILAVLIILYKLGHQHFEYDSGGEVINIKTQNPFWSRYLPRQKIIIIDFPKNKLDSYKIKRSFLKKTLEICVKSRRAKNGIIKLKFNITFLNNKEIKSLKTSLSKIIINNQQAGNRKADTLK